MITPETAKREMRTFLTERYPSINFDLKLTSKLNEISISVRWWNGPTEYVVDDLLDHFRSMQRYWSNDESGRPQAHDMLEERMVVNSNGILEARLYTPMQINCERLYTREVLQEAANALAKKLEIAPPQVIDTIAEVLIDNGIDIKDSTTECQSSLGKYYDIDDAGVCHEGVPLRELIMENLRRRRFAF